MNHCPTLAPQGPVRAGDGSLRRATAMCFSQRSQFYDRHYACQPATVISKSANSFDVQERFQLHRTLLLDIRNLAEHDGPCKRERAFPRRLNAAVPCANV
jgi:hypothetical protein